MLQETENTARGRGNEKRKRENEAIIVLFCFLRIKDTPQSDKSLCKNFYQTRGRMQNLSPFGFILNILCVLMSEPKRLGHPENVKTLFQCLDIYKCI